MTTAHPDPVKDLPDGLRLPLSSGEEWWYWTADRLALDFVNTLRERWRRRVECLCGPADLAAWLRRAGVLDHDARATTRQLRAARELREAIDAAACAVADGGVVAGRDIAIIDAWMRRAGRPGLAVRDGLPVLDERGPATDVATALGMIAVDAARLLGTSDRDRLRVCAAPDCSARFYDRSPAARRRWCSMARCGNRTKVRAHRARLAHRTEDP